MPDALAESPALATAGPDQCPELCIVVPVLNERDNIAALVSRIDAVLPDARWEVIFVDDDSTDGTREEIAALGRRDGRVRLLHRIGRRGLASAFVEGAQASLAPFIAAMDGDLQHDEALLPDMLRCLREDGVEIAVGSRYVAGGGVGEWDATRAGMSDLATRLSRIALRTTLTDPMSGFFMLRREVFDAAARDLSAIGFKILLDIVASSPRAPVIRELPYRFRLRVAGESKLDAGVLRDFVLLLIDKRIGHLIPTRFLLFAMVGAVGIAAHLIVLRLCLGLGLGFPVAQGVATACAIVGNYVLNNAFTFRDRRLRGWRFVRGLITFGLVCGVGAAANLSVASFLFDHDMDTWWMAGLAGAAMSLVWNYAASTVLTWPNASRRRAGGAEADRRCAVVDAVGRR